eukprot:scaffold584_cov338-Pavlova_lutheri.AAC.15
MRRLFHESKTNRSAPCQVVCWCGRQLCGFAQTATDCCCVHGKVKHYPEQRALAGRSAHQQQALMPAQDTYLESRAEALHNVESTITELGGIFQQLAHLVKEQGEVAIRIDENMDDTLSNVDQAQGLPSTPPTPSFAFTLVTHEKEGGSEIKPVSNQKTGSFWGRSPRATPGSQTGAVEGGEDGLIEGYTRFGWESKGARIPVRPGSPPRGRAWILPERAARAARAALVLRSEAPRHGVERGREAPTPRLRGWKGPGRRRAGRKAAGTAGEAHRSRAGHQGQLHRGRQADPTRPSGRERAGRCERARDGVPAAEIHAARVRWAYDGVCKRHQVRPVDLQDPRTNRGEADTRRRMLLGTRPVAITPRRIRLGRWKGTRASGRPTVPRSNLPGGEGCHDPKGWS